MPGLSGNTITPWQSSTLCAFNQVISNSNAQLVGCKGFPSNGAVTRHLIQQGQCLAERAHHANHDTIRVDYRLL